MITDIARLIVCGVFVEIFIDSFSLLASGRILYLSINRKHLLTGSSREADYCGVCQN
jgi:hypothetical protein